MYKWGNCEEERITISTQVTQSIDRAGIQTSKYFVSTGRHWASIELNVEVSKAKEKEMFGT